MSSPFFFICTKTTADFVVPVSAPNQAEFNRRVKNAFAGLIGGVLRVGDIKVRPTQTAVPNHLLCDGSEITRAQFPELTEFLNPGQSTATLPDYSGDLTVATPTEAQVIGDGGTVSTGAPSPAPSPGTGGTSGGNVPSGGRPVRLGGVLEN